MELKQLEFFISCVECGSLSKAAEKLYTSQPNVSKVIRSLENELGSPLFERTSKGLRLTVYGKEVYEYAFGIIKNVDMMKKLKYHQRKHTFDISAYPSHMMARLLVKLYEQYRDLQIEHREGSVEEIICHVEQGISEIGVFYISEKHLTALQNILSCRKMSFKPLGHLKACIYAGINSPVYNRESISFEELMNLKYIQQHNDFFSIEEDVEHFSLGVVRPEDLQMVVKSNSNHVVTDFLVQTDVVTMGLSLDSEEYRSNSIKNIAIDGEETNLILGYSVVNGRMLSEYAESFIRLIKDIIQL